MTDRFIIDDCGTLIDTYNRNTYDYVSEIAPILNQQYEENIKIKQLITEAYTNERTAIGRNVLKQLINNIEEEQ